jgi:hypothetical protein
LQAANRVFQFADAFGVGLAMRRRASEERDGTESREFIGWLHRFDVPFFRMP